MARDLGLPRLCVVKYVPLDAVFVDYANAHHSSGAAVEVHAQLDSRLDQLDTLLRVHAGPVLVLQVAVEKRGSGATDGVGHAQHHPAQRNVVHLSAALPVPASDDDPRQHRPAIRIAALAELIGGHADFGWLAFAKLVVPQQSGHMIGNGLGVGGGSAAAAVDVVGDPGQLVRHAVDHIASGTGAGVRADDNAAIVLRGHDGSASAERYVTGIHYYSFLKM